MKNTNSYSNNSSDLNDNENYDLYGTFKYDLSLPLKKLGEDYTNYLKPKLSFRYSPNGNTDLTSNDLLLNFDNVLAYSMLERQIGDFKYLFKAYKVYSPKTDLLFIINQNFLTDH